MKETNVNKETITIVTAKDTERADKAIKQLRDFIELRKAQSKMTVAENKESVANIAKAALVIAHDNVRSIATELGVDQ